MDRYQLIEYVRRRLGHPVIKVELDDSQILDEIIYSRKKYIKWACGNATQEYYFTLLLSGGQCVYDLPEGVTEVVSIDDKGSSMYGGINTLFTLENYLYMNGALNPWNWGGGSQDGVNPIVNYHISLDYIETIRMYTPSVFNWTYFGDQNQIQLNPCPPVSGGCLSVCTSGVSGNYYKAIDSPGYILIKSMAVKGASLPGYTQATAYNSLYDKNWIQDYIVARCKIILGMIRRKFANFNSIGNTGISLDGSELIQEGKEEIEKLEEIVKEEENYCGYPILIG